MTKAWDAAHNSFITVVCQIRDRQHFGYYINNPYTNTQLVQFAKKIILNMGLFKSKYKDWNALPPTDKTWANMIAFWTECY